VTPYGVGRCPQDRGYGSRQELLSLGETEGLFKALNPLSHLSMIAPLAFSRGAFLNPF